MLKKPGLFYLLLTVFFAYSCYAGTALTVKLLFPSKNGAAASAPNPIEEALEVSGKLVIDIAPYPAAAEKDRYLAEYFLNDQLLFETTGFPEGQTGSPDFQYTLDTACFENGRYKLTVNFWDSRGETGIGMREIIINNPQDE